MRFAYYLPCFLFLLSISCGARSTDSSLEQKKQFSLEIGKMEDQIDLMQLEGVPFQHKIRLFMKDGIYYVSNGASFKVLKFSSYGDLLALYYNSQKNPEPVLLRNSADSDTIANRNAYVYAFRKAGEIAVSSEGMLLVEDEVATDIAYFDEQLGAMLKKVILRFSPEGMLIDFLGQEGIGGTPFPYIEKLLLNEKDEIIVVSRTLDRRFVYWYSRHGDLLYRVVFEEDALPVPDPFFIASLDTVFPDPTQPLLFLKVDYYHDEQSEGENHSFAFYKSSIRVLSAATGELVSQFDLPKTYKTYGSGQFFSSEKEEVLFLFAGVAREHLFFLSPRSERQYQLYLLRKDGVAAQKALMDLDDADTVYRSFFLTSAGILTAFVGEKLAVSVVLWRTDRLITGVTDETG